VEQEQYKYHYEIWADVTVDGERSSYKYKYEFPSNLPTEEEVEEEFEEEEYGGEDFELLDAIDCDEHEVEWGAIRAYFLYKTEDKPSEEPPIIY
jgi:hypothetical protein